MRSERDAETVIVIADDARLSAGGSNLCCFDSIEPRGKRVFTASIRYFFWLVSYSSNFEDIHNPARETATPENYNCELKVALLKNETKFIASGRVLIMKPRRQSQLLQLPLK